MRLTHRPLLIGVLHVVQHPWRVLIIAVALAFACVGLALAKLNGPACEIDTFLLSCRVIGRSVETALLATLAADAARAGAKKLVAPEEAYLKSVDKTGFEALLKRAGIDTKFAAAAKE